MRRTFEDALSWSATGTGLFLDAVAGWGEEQYLALSGLPGWTRKHLVAHVAANADALSNLVRWAATGEKTPMYASIEQRDADIAAGSGKPAAELAAWLHASADRLAAGTAALSTGQWAAEVVTAQGRTVPATEIPWLRSREVCVHAVDLAVGVCFADLPTGFLTALADDIAGKRGTAPGPALILTTADTDNRWKLPGTNTTADRREPSGTNTTTDTGDRRDLPGTNDTGDRREPFGEGDALAVTGPLAEVVAYLAGRPHTLSSVPALPAWL